MVVGNKEKHDTKEGINQEAEWTVVRVNAAKESKTESVANEDTNNTVDEEEMERNDGLLPFQSVCGGYNPFNGDGNNDPSLVPGNKSTTSASFENENNSNNPSETVATGDGDPPSILPSRHVIEEASSVEHSKNDDAASISIHSHHHHHHHHDDDDDDDDEASAHSNNKDDDASDDDEGSGYSVVSLEYPSDHVSLSLSDKPPPPTCPICFDVLQEEEEENFVVDLGDLEEGGNNKKVVAVVVEPCKHTFCRPCMIQSIQSNVRARLVPSRCPMNRCRVRLQTELVRSILSSQEGRGAGGDDDGTTIASNNNNNNNKELLDYYVRLEKLNKNPSLVECTKCRDIINPTEASSSPTHRDKNNMLCCTHCGHEFCRHHGDAHPGMSCSEWFKSTEDGRRVRRSEQKLRRLTKPCPHCGIQIQKKDGCNHVYCTSCHKDMCWKCGAGYNPGDGHVCVPLILRPFCSLLSARWRRRFSHCWEYVEVAALILALVVASIIWIVFGVAMALGSGCFFCGWCCWKRDPTREDGTVGGRRWSEWGKWNPRRGPLLGCALACFPLGRWCFEEHVDDLFPNIYDRVETVLSNVASALRAILRFCFCRWDQGSDFPVMPVVVAKRGGATTNNKKTETAADKRSNNNDSINETLAGTSSEGEQTV